LRKPRRFELALLACECDARGRLGREDAPYAAGQRLRAALAVARDIDAAAVAAEEMARGAQGPAVGDAIRRARIDALEAFAELDAAR